MKSLLSLPILVLAVAPTIAAPEDPSPKSDLKVLFVGQDPEAPQVPFPDLATERTYELHRERAAAFEALLSDHFESVRVVFGADYVTSMSETVDVTVFDALPKTITKGGQVKDPETGAVRYARPSYLPESFDRPAVLIGFVSPRIGEPLGLKLDWL